MVGISETDLKWGSTGKNAIRVKLVSAQCIIYISETQGHRVMH